MRKGTTALTRVTEPPKPPALVSASLATLEQAIGGRLALVAALSHAPKSRDLDFLLALVGDPSYAKAPLADLCAKGGITPGELIEAYKSGEINRAQALALQKVGAQLEQVAADTMRLSLPHDVTCTACWGTGSVTPEPTKTVPSPQPGPCDDCGGTGVITLQGDLEHKKLALDMGKLIAKSGGVNLNVNQNVANFGAAAGGSLERLQAATDAILFGAGVAPPEAAEVVEGDTVPAGESAVVEGDWREEAR
jgi:hypothetical protein